MKVRTFGYMVAATIAASISGLDTRAVEETCSHTGKTNERLGEQDCVTCTADGTQANNGANGSACSSKKHDTINAWCKCVPNTKCYSTANVRRNQTISKKSNGTCNVGVCGGEGGWQEENGWDLTEMDQTGC